MRRISRAIKGTRRTVKYLIEMHVTELQIIPAPIDSYNLKCTLSRGPKTATTEILKSSGSFSFEEKLKIVATMTKKQDGTFAKKMAKFVIIKIEDNFHKTTRRLGSLEINLAEIVDPARRNGVENKKMTVDFPNSKRKAYMQTILSYAKREVPQDCRSDAESECSVNSVGSNATFQSNDTSLSISTISTPIKNKGQNTTPRKGTSLMSLAKKCPSASYQTLGKPESVSQTLASPSSVHDARLAIQKIERMKKDGASEDELSLARIKELNNLMGAPIVEEPEEDDQVSINTRIHSQIRIMDDHIEKILHLFDKKDACIKQVTAKVFKYKVKCKKLDKKYEKLKQYYNSLETAYVQKCDHYLELLDKGPEEMLDKVYVKKEQARITNARINKGNGLWWILGY